MKYFVCCYDKAVRPYRSERKVCKNVRWGKYFRNIDVLSLPKHMLTLLVELMSSIVKILISNLLIEDRGGNRFTKRFTKIRR